VQSAVRGNDDGAFYRELGITEDLLPLKATLAKYQPDLVISVRLHGAIESLLSGVPRTTSATSAKASAPIRTWVWRTG
jgi:polysaccharide pyruvyl transferase WcaK-like protein